MSQSDRTFDYRPVLAARAALRRKALVTQYVTLQTHVRDTQTRQHACGSTT